MYRIGKTLTFEAAHHLEDLPEGHKCRRPHGHSYVVEFELSAESLDDRSFVEDYGLLSELVRGFDHQDLNEVLPPWVTPTAEELASFFATQLVHIVRAGVRVNRVVVRETASSWAEYRP